MSVCRAQRSGVTARGDSRGSGVLPASEPGSVAIMQCRRFRLSASVTCRTLVISLRLSCLPTILKSTSPRPVVDFSTKGGGTMVVYSEKLAPFLPFSSEALAIPAVAPGALYPFYPVASTLLCLSLMKPFCSCGISWNLFIIFCR